MKYLQIIIIISVIVSCASPKEHSSHKISTSYEIMDEIQLKKQKYELILKESGLIITMPKSQAIKFLESYIDTFNLNIDSGVIVSYSKKMREKFLAMKNILIDNNYYEILNIEEIDSLKNYDLLMKTELMEKDAEIGFRLYFNGILCQLLEKGELSIIENDTYIDKILKYHYSESDEYSGSSYIIFQTPTGRKVCNCPPYMHYN